MTNTLTDGGPEHLAPTLEEKARAINYSYYTHRHDGALTAAQWADGIVNGRDSRVRWQDTMMARERHIGSVLAREIVDEIRRLRSKP